MDNGCSNDSPTRKPSPQAFSIDLNNFTQAVDWLKDHTMKHHDILVDRVVFDAYPKLWRCYSGDDIVANLEHDIMVRLALVLDQMEWLYEVEDVEAFEGDDGA